MQMNDKSKHYHKKTNRSDYISKEKCGEKSCTRARLRHWISEVKPFVPLCNFYKGLSLILQRVYSFMLISHSFDSGRD